MAANHWMSLALEADQAVVKCNFCSKYGHGATQCPELANIERSGVSVQSVVTPRKFNRAYDLVLLVSGFLAGVAITKLVEVMFA